ncbi:hypothetical protein PENSPDRAFT_252364 [Peniophora sp. CONT]|nr:hypothetical protein PENSPDRAFT_252364 [Peniophora sp. CONT]
MVCMFVFKFEPTRLVHISPLLLYLCPIIASPISPPATHSCSAMRFLGSLRSATRRDMEKNGFGEKTAAALAELNRLSSCSP